VGGVIGVEGITGEEPLALVMGAFSASYDPILRDVSGPTALDL